LLAAFSQSVGTEMTKYKLDLVAVEEVRGVGVVVSWQTVIHFSMERYGTLIIT